eukprot:1158125-Pelagomonas_calceolata.AAC.2
MCGKHACMHACTHTHTYTHTIHVNVSADIGGHRGASPWGDECGGEEGGNSYEDLCRAHIEAMVNAAAAQEVQSELAQRVSGGCIGCSAGGSTAETWKIFVLGAFLGLRLRAVVTP